MELLLDAAVEVGLDRDTCLRFLSSGVGEAQINRTVDRVHALGIRSIPTLIIDGGRYIIDGAAEAGTVLTVLKQIVSEKCTAYLADNGDADTSPTVFQQGLQF